MVPFGISWRNGATIELLYGGMLLAGNDGMDWCGEATRCTHGQCITCPVKHSISIFFLLLLLSIGSTRVWWQWNKTRTRLSPLVCAAGGQSTSAKCLDCSSTFPFIHCKYQFNFVLLTVSTLSPLALVVMAVVSDFEFVCVRELVSTLA